MTGGEPAPRRRIDGEQSRRRRANGEQSRRRILDAAAAVATERGYEGTSIAAVSKRSGLPASSIYWHFEDKDALIAAVIEQSFDTWLAVWELPEDGEALERIRHLARRIAESLLRSPDFLRLGLMLTLERRPVEPSARTVFLQVRDRMRNSLVDEIASFAPELHAEAVDLLATYAIAGADGIFLAREVAGDDIDLFALFDMHAHAFHGALERARSDAMAGRRHA